MRDCAHFNIHLALIVNIKMSANQPITDVSALAVFGLLWSRLGKSWEIDTALNRAATVREVRESVDLHARRRAC